MGIVDRFGFLRKPRRCLIERFGVVVVVVVVAMLLICLSVCLSMNIAHFPSLIKSSFYLLPFLPE